MINPDVSDDAVQKTISMEQRTKFFVCLFKSHALYFDTIPEESVKWLFKRRVHSR